MSRLWIEIDGRRTTFAPGTLVSGSAHWELETPPESVELSLFWYTEGKGDRDVGEAARATFNAPAQGDQRPFALSLPTTPISFSGQLISVVWALELVAEPGEQTVRLEILVSPSGEEVHLAQVADPLDDAPAWAKSAVVKIGRRAGSR